jgi:hypothetical protein
MAARDSVTVAGCPLTLSPSPTRGGGGEIAEGRSPSSSSTSFSSSPLSPCGRGAGGEGQLAIGVPESRTMIEHPHLHAVLLPLLGDKALLHALLVGRECGHRKQRQPRMPATPSAQKARLGLMRKTPRCRQGQRSRTHLRTPATNRTMFSTRGTFKSRRRCCRA